MQDLYEPRRLKRWKLPDSYMGAHWDGHYVFLGQHRDSDALTRSNFRVALRELEELPAPPELPEDCITRETVSENHWAVGWVEWIAIHETDTAALEAADEMVLAMEDYPVLDDCDLSELEFAEASEYWERMRWRDRAEAIKFSGSSVSLFACRRDDLPEDDDGRLLSYLTRE